MQTITCAKIRELKPCYDPALRLPEDYSGSIVDFLKQEQIPAEDRIWVVRNFVSDRTNRLFAVWCVRQALALQKIVDPRSVSACDVAERFAMGKATLAEMESAYSAAHSAAEVAYLAYSAAEAAAYSAAEVAHSAHSAAEVAYLAYSAAEAAAYSAYSAYSAAEVAAYSVAYLAYSVAKVAAAESVRGAEDVYSGDSVKTRSVQIQYLIKLVEGDLTCKQSPALKSES